MDSVQRRSIHEICRQTANRVRLWSIVRKFKPSSDSDSTKASLLDFVQKHKAQICAMDVKGIKGGIEKDLTGEPDGVHRQIMKAAEFAWSTIEHDPRGHVDLSKVKRGQWTYPGSIFPHYDWLSRSSELDMFDFVSRIRGDEAGFGDAERNAILRNYVWLFGHGGCRLNQNGIYAPARFLNFFTNELLERPEAWKALDSNERLFLISHIICGSLTGYDRYFLVTLDKVKHTLDDYFASNGRILHLTAGNQGLMVMTVDGWNDCTISFTPRSLELATKAVLDQRFAARS